MFLLDTDVVSELHKVAEGKADANVAAWQASVDELGCFLSVITVQEPDMGVLRIERRDPVQGRRLRAWLEQRVIPAFAGRILPIDQTIALRWAQLHVPDPRPCITRLLPPPRLFMG